VIYFQIANPYRAVFGIADLCQALQERAMTTLRHVVGVRAVQSVVTEREAIAFEIAEIVSDVASSVVHGRERISSTQRLPARELGMGLSFPSCFTPHSQSPPTFGRCTSSVSLQDSCFRPPHWLYGPPAWAASQALRRTLHIGVCS
jgi:hypothetical protein